MIEKQPGSAPTLKPMGIAASILYFGIPALVFAASILGLLPWMIRRGVALYPTFLVTFCGPLALMLGAAFVAYRLEGRPWAWPAFRDRMRLRRMNRGDWLWTIGLVLGTYLVQYAISPVVAALSGVGLYEAPAEFSAFMARLGRADFGFDLTGRWDVFLVITLGMLVFNIVGEEFWWRGIILPRQELALGRWAWLVNGVLWDLFHFFYHTSLGSIVGYLPITLLSYVAQRRKSTWPGIIAHFISNIALPIGLLYRVLGLPLPGG